MAIPLNLRLWLWWNECAAASHQSLILSKSVGSACCEITKFSQLDTCNQTICAKGQRCIMGSWLGVANPWWWGYLLLAVCFELGSRRTTCIYFHCEPAKWVLCDPTWPPQRTVHGKLNGWCRRHPPSISKRWYPQLTDPNVPPVA